MPSAPALLSTAQLQMLKSLLVTRSASGTGNALGLTQSAVSHGLAALRRHFGDELLVRRGRTMELTPFAAGLLAPVRALLRDIEDVSALRETFDPQAFTGTCVIALRDLTLSTLAIELLPRFRAQAPLATLGFVPWESERLAGQLASGACDYAIGVDPPRQEMGLLIRKLYEDDFVAVCARGAAPANGLTIEALARRPALVVSRTDDVRSPVDEALAAHGLRRHIVIRSAFFLAAFSIVRDSDLLMVAPRRLVLKHGPDFDLTIMELPLPVPSFSVYGVAHERFAASPLNKWLRALCTAAVLKGAPG